MNNDSDTVTIMTKPLADCTKFILENHETLEVKPYEDVTITIDKAFCESRQPWGGQED